MTGRFGFRCRKQPARSLIQAPTNRREPFTND
jgi:hypothetical protein